MEVGPVEIRVLGCLVEKQRTTPDAYPLSLNALRLACNQATNRDPVVEYDDTTIRAGLERLARKRWARMASGQGSRAPKYRHLLSETLGLPEDELSLLAILMLRGTQTPGELKQRGERLHAFGDLESVEGALERLIERRHVRRLERRPGQKEERYAQLLGAADGETPAVASQVATGPASPDYEPATNAHPPREGEDSESIERRLTRLEEEVVAVRDALTALERELGA
ncbi:MAG: YceH family protein [Thermoleophilaceae bacterium]|nr:YceH family protein [Thermoleophilaceae bacterium]